jgi:hypothetical protein
MQIAKPGEEQGNHSAGDDQVSVRIYARTSILGTIYLARG